jgi:hypothetical protein
MQKKMLMAFLIVLSIAFSVSISPTYATITCDTGTLNTTCNISTTKTAAAGEIETFNGTLIIWTTGIINPAGTGAGNWYYLNGISTANITVVSGGQINGNVNITVFNLTVYGIINGAGQGYAGGGSYATGSGPCPGKGVSSQSGGGAGYGGLGGKSGSSPQTAGGCQNGDSIINSPNLMGSGGGGGNGGTAGVGGGAVLINVTNQLALSGTISVNGTKASGGSTYYPGSGAGGSIWINATTISGAGTISANGGAGIGTDGYASGGGAGGRISLQYVTNSFTGSIQAYPGGYAYAPAGAGGTGSISKKTYSATNPDITYNGNNQNEDGSWTAINATLTFNSLTVDRGAIVNFTGFPVTAGATLVNGSAVLQVWNESNVILGDFDLNGTFYQNENLTSTGNVNVYSSGSWIVQTNKSTSITGTLTIKNGGQLYHIANTNAKFYFINMTVGGFALNSGGTITIIGSGYSGGAINTKGNGPGGGGISSNTGGGGGGYGGNGGNGYPMSGTPLGGTTYDTISNPNNLGSGGGGSGNAAGGAGGGLLIINSSGDIDVSGTISANGNNAASSNYAAGGGSGGAIVLDARSGTFSGAGTIQVNGGNSLDGAYTGGGGGGGGKIAIYYNSKTYSGSVQTYSGSKSASNPGYNGGAGIIYLKPTASTSDIIVDAFKTADAANTAMTNFSSDISDNFNSLRFDEGAAVNITTGNFNITSITGNNSAGLIIQNAIILNSTGTTTIINSATITNNAGSNIILGDFLVNSTFYQNENITMNNAVINSTGTWIVQTGNMTNVMNNFTIQKGGKLYHIANSQTKSYFINMSVGNFSLNFGGLIDDTGNGYVGGAGTYKNGYGPGAGKNSGSDSSGGAGYGGTGGTPSVGSNNGRNTYNIISNPNDLGSGGGGSNSAGGNGGGLVIINSTGNVDISGIIYVNGSSGAGAGGQGGGGGSGGAVVIDADAGIFSGNGSIKATGGLGSGAGPYAGGGGGGKIAIYYNSNTFTGAIQAYGSSGGGSGATAGGAGVIYLRQTGLLADILINNNNIAAGSDTNFTSAYSENFNTLTAANSSIFNLTSGAFNLGNVSINNSATFYLWNGSKVSFTNLYLNSTFNQYENITGNMNATIHKSGIWNVITNKTTNVTNTFTIENGGYMTSTSNGANNKFYIINITLTNLYLNSGGQIDVGGDGYSGGTATYVNGNGPGAGKGSAGNAAGGAGYGGMGGRSSDGLNAGGITYNIISYPIDTGSGGGGANYAGGNGGGLLIINATGDVDISGLLSMNGTDGGVGGYGGGGGSGGAAIIDVRSGTLSGSGSIKANGGKGTGASPYSGGGGGGKIAIYYNSNTFTGAIQAYGSASGGSGAINGAAGIIYLRSTGSNADILIDNYNLAGAAADTNFTSAYSDTFNSITIRNNSIFNLTSGTFNLGTTKLNSSSTFYIWPGAKIITGDFYINSTLNQKENITTIGSLIVNQMGVWNIQTGNMTNITNNFTIQNGGQVTHSANSNAKAYFINISAGNFSLNSGGIINTDSFGYSGGINWAKGNGPGAGLGDTGTSVGGGGAGYGGDGGYGYNSVAAGGFGYDNLSYPTNLGSGGGGGQSGCPGGSGGGLVIINITNSADISGAITANGTFTSCAGAGGGGGSGGAIVIDARNGNISGSGALKVNGGWGTGGSNQQSGGGGGGKIVLYYNNKTFTGAIQAYGGGIAGSAQRGGAGVIVQIQTGQSPDILLDDNNQATVANTTFNISLSDTSFNNLIVTNGTAFNIKNGVFNLGNTTINNSASFTLQSGANVSIFTFNLNGTFNDYNNITVNSASVYKSGIWNVITNKTTSITYNLTILNGGLLTHAANTNTELYFINFTVGNLSVNFGGNITANAVGYSGGASSNNGNGPGKGTYGGSSCPGSGAGYGGNGGNGDTGTGIGGGTYNTLNNPQDLGSGGGGGNTGAGGNGGGLIIFNVLNDADISGTIFAIGGSGSTDSYPGGAGSGGAIILDIRSGALTGNGTIRANGGNGGGSYTYSGGGGGGKIAIYYNTKTFNGNITAYGGIYGTGSSTAGGAGVIYQEPTGFNPDVKIDNNQITTLYAQTNFNGTVSDVFNSLVVDRNATLNFTGGNFNITTLWVNTSSKLYLQSGALVNISNFNVNSSFYQNENISTTDVVILGNGTWTISSTKSIKSLNNFTIQNGGILTHTGGATSQGPIINITTKDFYLLSGGKVNLNVLGFPGRTGGALAGYGPGAGGASSGSNGGGGAGHGGLGGNGSSATNGGSIYDSASAANQWGSSGGTYSTETSGSGGGSIFINASGTMFLGSTISVNGTAGTGSYYAAGGGSGGSIWLRANFIKGTGGLHAGGGNGGPNGGAGYYGGGGAGGIIIILSCNNASYSGSYIVNGGASGGGTATAGAIGILNITDLQCGETYSLNSTNSTLAGTPVQHNLYWSDSNGLSGYIFQFCNGTWSGGTCSGGWANNTWTSFGGGPTTAWANVTTVINSTIASQIAWCEYVNDTITLWNGTSCQNAFFYTASGQTTISLYFDGIIGDRTYSYLSISNATCARQQTDDTIILYRNGTQVAQASPGGALQISDIQTAMPIGDYNYTCVYTMGNYSAPTVSNIMTIKGSVPGAGSQYFCYDMGNVSSNASVSNAVIYDYSCVVQTLNFSTLGSNWNSIKQVTDYASQNDVKTVLRLYLDNGTYNSTYQRKIQNDLNQYLVDIQSSPWTYDFAMILFDVNGSANYAPLMPFQNYSGNHAFGSMAELNGNWYYGGDTNETCTGTGGSSEDSWLEFWQINSTFNGNATRRYNATHECAANGFGDLAGPLNPTIISNGTHLIMFVNGNMNETGKCSLTNCTMLEAIVINSTLNVTSKWTLESPTSALRGVDAIWLGGRYIIVYENNSKIRWMNVSSDLGSSTSNHFVVDNAQDPRMAWNGTHFLVTYFNSTAYPSCGGGGSYICAILSGAVLNSSGYNVQNTSIKLYNETSAGSSTPWTFDVYWDGSNWNIYSQIIGGGDKRIEALTLGSSLNILTSFNITYNISTYSSYTGVRRINGTTDPKVSYLGFSFNGGMGSFSGGTLYEPYYFNLTGSPVNDTLSNATYWANNATHDWYAIKVINYQFDGSYASTINFPYYSPTDQISFINSEEGYLRNTTATSRIYFNMNSTLNAIARDYHHNIMNRLRGTPSLNTTIPTYIAEISTATEDVVIFNNQSAQQQFNISLGNRTGLDVWDATNKAVLNRSTSGRFSVNVSAYNFTMIYFDSLDHIIFGSLGTSSSLFKNATPAAYWSNYTKNADSGNTTFYNVLALQGHADAKIELWDPSWGIYNQYIGDYGWINSSNIGNWSPYTYIIFANGWDYSQGIPTANEGGNSSATMAAFNVSISSFIGDSNRQKIYGYIGLFDYNDSDKWALSKEWQILNWTANDAYTNVFVDGLDTGISGVNFTSRLKDLTDFVHQQQRKLILNDYTSFQNVSEFGDMDMKESFCGRWDNTSASYNQNNNITYSWELWWVDVQRATFAETSTKPQLAVAYGPENDTYREEYCYAMWLVFYGPQNNNSFTYRQPNYQQQREFMTFNPGKPLDATWSNSSLNDYYRRYANGIVHIYNDTKTWSFDVGQTTNNATFCIDFYNNNLGTNKYGANLTIMRANETNINQTYLVNQSEIGGAGSWKTVCRDITSSGIYNSSAGRYVVFITPYNRSDATYLDIGEQVINLTLSSINQNGMHSWYDTSVYDFSNTPANNFTNWTFMQSPTLYVANPYPWNNLGCPNPTCTGGFLNWKSALYVNISSSPSIDTIQSGVIAHTEQTATGLVNVTLSTNNLMNISIWDNGTYLNVPLISRMRFLNNGVWTTLNTTNTTDCLSSSPTWNKTNLDYQGYTWGACYSKIDSTHIFIRANIPHLSSQLYGADGDLNAPTFSNINQNVTNTSTIARGAPVSLSAKWSDDNQLDSWLIYNGTYNMTSVAFVSPGNWTNVTWNSTGLTLGATYTIIIYGNDTSNNQNQIVWQYTIDGTPPTFSNYGTNYTNNTGIAKGQNISLWAQWNDNIQLGNWWFYNGTIEIPASTFSTGNWSNTTWNTTGLVIGNTYNIYLRANDTSGNMNQIMWQYTVTSGDYLLINSTTLNSTTPNPTEAGNTTLQLIVNFTNSTKIGTCAVSLYNTTMNLFNYTSGMTLSGAGNQWACIDTFGMEFFRNPGQWNVSVNINETSVPIVYTNFTSINFTYGTLLGIGTNASSLIFTGIPGQTINGTNGFPLEIENTGNVQISTIQFNSSDFVIGSATIGVGNLTYNTTGVNDIFVQSTKTQATIFTNIPYGQNVIRDMWFKGYIPYVQANTYTGTIMVTGS